MKSYLFYDIETSGMNNSFNQILQFAAIRTDENLEETERFNIYVKLRPDIIPEPVAAITHRIPLTRLFKGVTEYELAGKLYEIFNKPGTVSLGYNSLSFDEEFIRSLFFRNFYNPYTHQYQNNCRRMDLLSMTTVYRVFKNDIIKWPFKEGKPTLKLEEINNINSFTSGQAHDAMVDVEVTVELAKKLKENRKLWDHLEAGFEKKEEETRLRDFEKETIPEYGKPMAVIINTRLGSDNNYFSVVMSLCNSEFYSNQQIWLRLDYLDFSKDFNLVANESKAIIRRKSCGSETVLPFNKKTEKLLDENRFQLIKNNIVFINEHKDLLEVVAEKQRKFKYESIEGYDIDSSLYLRGLFSKEESNFTDKFHKEINKIKMINLAPNDNIQEMSRRIVFRNFPEAARVEYKTDYANFINSRLFNSEQKLIYDYRGEFQNDILNTEKEIKEIRLTRQLDKEQINILNELEEYIKERKSR